MTYVRSTSFVTDAGQNVEDIVFLCEYASGEAFPLSSDEVEKVLWLTTEEILNHPKAPIYLKDSIKQADVNSNSFVTILLGFVKLKVILTDRGIEQTSVLSDLK